MSATTLRTGDRLPSFKRTVTVQDAPVNLSAATSVLFKVANPTTGTVIISQSAVVQDAAAGVVTYTLSAGDTSLLPVGSYFYWFEIQFSGGLVLTAPNNEPETLIITDQTSSLFTYTGDPSTREIDAVRFYIGDTDSDDPFLQDNEIQYLIDTWKPKTNSLLYVAAIAADAIAARLTREVSYSGDGVSVGADQLQSKYQALAEQLRDQYKKEVSASSSVWFTSDFWEANYDPTIKPLSFGIGMHDNPAAGPQEPITPNASSWYNYYYGF